MADPHHLSQADASASALSAYPAGHHESVLRSHLSRTAENSAQHLVPHLKPGLRILDVGCGPGTISRSLASLVGPSGQVIGMDPSQEVIQQASSGLGAGEHANVSFEVGDAVKLRFGDSTFDIVHANQVLQHVRVSDQVTILKEMRRVVKKPGGILSLREGDMTASSIFPDPNDQYRNFIATYVRTARTSGADPQFASKIHQCLRKSGFSNDEVAISARAQVYGGNKPSEAIWWGESWESRCLLSGFHDNAISSGQASEEDMQNLAKMWKDWSQSGDDAWWAMLNTEVICTVS